jgi:hypothetical protein
MRCSLSLVAQTDGPPLLQVNVAEILTTKQVGVTLLFSHSMHSCAPQSCAISTDFVQEWTVALEWWHRARCTVLSPGIHRGTFKPHTVCSASQNVEAKLRLADA